MGHLKWMLCTSRSRLLEFMTENIFTMWLLSSASALLAALYVEDDVC